MVGIVHQDAGNQRGRGICQLLVTRGGCTAGGRGGGGERMGALSLYLEGASNNGARLVTKQKSKKSNSMIIVKFE